MKDEVQIKRDGNFFTVIVNGWLLFNRDYIGYDSDEDIIDKVYQDIYDELKITEEQFNQQFIII